MPPLFAQNAEIQAEIEHRLWYARWVQPLENLVYDPRAWSAVLLLVLIVALLIAWRNGVFARRKREE